jgi:DsbC/DsbD-like thiol-disulfide interchange protein
MRPLAVALALCMSGAARAQVPPAVQVSAIPEVASIAPGGAFRVAVRLRIPDGCHISWINPGQSGLPTTIAWQAPTGVSAGETEWPYPERDETAGFVSHVYRGVAVVVTRFLADSSLRTGVAVLRAELSWGLCGATCVPHRDTVALSLPVRRGPAETTAQWRALAPSLDALPLASTALTVRAVALGDSVRLTIAGSPLSARTSGTVTFFPRPSGVAVVAAIRRRGRVVTVTLPARAFRVRPSRLAGVLVADGPWLVGSQRRALAIDAVVD